MIFENTWACDPLETLTGQQPPSFPEAFFARQKKRLTKTGKRAWKAYGT